MAQIPQDLRYVSSHEWFRDEGDGTHAIGLTDFAQRRLGDIVFINLPQEGDELVAGRPFCDVESVKAVSDVFAPVSGHVVMVNEGLADDPGAINEDPYGAWICRVSDVCDVDGLMDAASYDSYCATAKE
ncbi:glycine cleavage system protein GcvH [Olsenella massiliensis]|uniref:glycine cleavage system protein GcvH n=1 Tax=Olsenella massiliensis TaxID=1622075 RepID=UPI00071D4A41|nr:glycine cleavage system protein GcvH [Olsenella massiliensis]